jgi:hypothetical protein
LAAAVGGCIASAAHSLPAPGATLCPFSSVKAMSLALSSHHSFL